MILAMNSSDLRLVVLRCVGERMSRGTINNADRIVAVVVIDGESSRWQLLAIVDFDFLQRA